MTRNTSSSSLRQMKEKFMKSKGSLHQVYRKRKQTEREVANVKMAARIINTGPYFTRMIDMKANNRKISELKRNKVKANRDRESMGALF